MNYRKLQDVKLTIKDMLLTKKINNNKNNMMMNGYFNRINECCLSRNQF